MQRRPLRLDLCEATVPLPHAVWPHHVAAPDIVSKCGTEVAPKSPAPWPPLPALRILRIGRDVYAKDISVLFATGLSQFGKNRVHSQLRMARPGQQVAGFIACLALRRGYCL
jgi:hypothetical protein